jgi:hypothetical protein
VSNGAWASGEVDLDALADYTAGVLDAADSAVIGDLVRTDPHWRHAHDALVAAEAAVLADLHTAAAVRLTMPADVADRIDAALAAERGRGVVVPIDAARSRRRVPSRRLSTRFAAAAAGIIAVAGGVAVATQFSARDFAGTTAAEAPAMDRGAPGEALSSGGAEWSSATVQVVATGRDYSAATAPELVREAAAIAPALPEAPQAPPAPSAASGEPGESTGGAAKYSILADADLTSRTAGGELARLAVPAALEACLTAVGSVISGTPSVVDFARYQGAPALIILVRERSASTVVIVGPDCAPGQPSVITTVDI